VVDATSSEGFLVAFCVRVYSLQACQLALRHAVRLGEGCGL